MIDWIAWRGPVWFPINYLLIEALGRFDEYYGDDLIVEYPIGSGNALSLFSAAEELFPAHRSVPRRRREPTDVWSPWPIADDPHWRDHILFYEYLHCDTGVGLGASHQTGWTGLVAELIEQCGNKETGG